MRIVRKVLRWCHLVRLNYQVISRDNTGATRRSCARAAIRWATREMHVDRWLPGATQGGRQ